MLILGIDPGYATIGYGLIKYEGNSFTSLDYGAIQTPAKTELPYRLSLIFDGVTELINKYRPAAMAIEELFFNTNITTGIAVGHARGVILLAAEKCGLRSYEYTPLQIKQSVVGYGRAEKKQVMEMTRIILKLEKIPRPDDAADALACAICHAHSYNSRLFR